jgi:hypothetical protein
MNKFFKEKNFEIEKLREHFEEDSATIFEYEAHTRKLLDDLEAGMYRQLQGRTWQELPPEFRERFVALILETSSRAFSRPGFMAQLIMIYDYHSCRGRP